MIRVTQAMTRKAGAERGDIQQRLRKEHGPLVASLSGALGFFRHVQSYSDLEEPPEGPRGKLEPSYDGLWELWFESEAALAERLASSSGKKALQAIVQNQADLLDASRSPLWIAHEYPQVNPCPENIVADPRSHVVKTIFLLRPAKGMSEADAQFYWRTHHGPLVRSHAMASCIKRYIQAHRHPSPLEAQLREAFGVKTAPYMGHVEVWFDRRENSAATDARAHAGGEIIPDERRYVDFPSSSTFNAKEAVFLDMFYGAR